MHGQVKKYRGAMHNFFGLVKFLHTSFTDTIPRRLGKAITEYMHLKSLPKKKSPKYYMRTSLTPIMPSFCIVKVNDPYEVIFFPWLTRLGCVLLCDR
jgi:hypothetical protein